MYQYYAKDLQETDNNVKQQVAVRSKFAARWADQFVAFRLGHHIHVMMSLWAAMLGYALQVLTLTDILTALWLALFYFCYDGGA